MLTSRLIVVVDDKSAIREAMSGLLTSWGHRVISAGSGDEAIERLSTCPERPDLLICDYRLPRKENGVDVIERLRSEYDESIPAILITGDTAPNRLAEAEASGLLLLHKPVSNGKLRAAIFNLIAVADDGDGPGRRSRRSNETGLAADRRRLSAIRHIQRPEDCADMGLHRLFGETEFTGDRLVGLTVAEPPEHVDLTLGQYLSPGARRGRVPIPKEPTASNTRSINGGM